MKRHIVSLPLPDNLYCPNKLCPWRGHREDARKRHIRSGKCGPKPKIEEERMIYNSELILSWVFEGIITPRVAEMYASDFVQERARELGNVNLWGDQPRYHAIAMPAVRRTERNAEAPA